MTKPDLEDQQDEPLDPGMERIRRKMIILQLVSGGIMFLCLMAVLGAIVYKVTRPSGDAAPRPQAGGALAVPADQPLTATAHLPAGFAIQSVSHSNGQILFYGQVDGVSKALVFDLSVGRVIADVTIATP